MRGTLGCMGGSGSGRRKQPTNLVLLRGETRPSRIGHGEPVPRPGEPEPPRARWWDKRHRDVWDRLTGELRAMHMLVSADRDCLVSLVRAVIRMELAAQQVAEQGVLVTGRDGGWTRNPALFVEQSAADAVLRLSRELGLTPVGRAGLRHAEPKPPDGAGPERLLSLPANIQRTSRWDDPRFGEMR